MTLKRRFVTCRCCARPIASLPSRSRSADARSCYGPPYVEACADAAKSQFSSAGRKTEWERLCPPQYQRDLPPVLLARPWVYGVLRWQYEPQGLLVVGEYGSGQDLGDVAALATFAGGARQRSHPRCGDLSQWIDQSSAGGGSGVLRSTIGAGPTCSTGTISGKRIQAGLRAKCSCTWSSSELHTSVRCSSPANIEAAHWSLSSSDKRWAPRYGGERPILPDCQNMQGTSGLIDAYSR